MRSEPPQASSRGFVDLALAVYLEDVCARKRVLYIGSADSGAPERLARVARAVRVLDPDTARSPLHRRNLTVTPGIEWPLPSKAGTYDVVLVPDVPAAGCDEAQRLAELRRVATPSGIVLACAWNDAVRETLTPPPAGTLAMDYQGLFDLLASTFDSVRMLGQAPFVAYAVVDFAPPAAEPGVTFDGSLLEVGGEAPERFIAVCGRADAVLDAYAIVQIPFHSVARGAATSVGDESAGELEPEQGDARRLADRLKQVELASAERHVRAQRLENDVARLTQETRTATARADALARELYTRESVPDARGADDDDRASESLLPTPPPPRDLQLLTRLQNDLRACQEQLDAANLHGEGLEHTLAERTAALAELDGELERLRIELDRTRDESEVRVAALRSARTELDQLRASPPQDDVSGDYAGLEKVLEERGHVVIALREEIDRRAVLVRDLVEELKRVYGIERHAPALAHEAAAPAGEFGAVEAASTAGHSIDDCEERVRQVQERLATASAALAQLENERDAAVARAVDAEVARTEGVFRIDELEGHVALSRRAADAELVALRESHAALEGRVRGMSARIAEVTELRDRAEGRLSLAEHDLLDAAERILDLERKLANVREELELELVRARARPPGEGGEVAGELSVLHSRVGDTEAERDYARADMIRLTALVTLLENRTEGARRGFELRIAELRADVVDALAQASRAAGDIGRLQSELQAASREQMELRGERDGLRARLADREEALRLHSVLGRDAPELRSQLGLVRESVREQALRSTDLSTTLSSRESWIEHLETERSASAERTQQLEDTLAELRSEIERLGQTSRQAQADMLARESEAQSRAVELEQAAREAELRASRVSSEREDLVRVLVETRTTLNDLAQSVRAAGHGDSRGASPTLVDGELGDGSADSLAREAQDRDLIVRSMAAQIEERDDRIHALERRLKGGQVSAEADLLQRELMEMQERVARLTEELVHEREARTAAEVDLAQASRRTDHDGEVRRLHEQLGGRDAELLMLRGKVSTAERDLRAIRDACAQARSGLEEVLGSATAGGDQTTAERVGNVLRVLSRF